MSDTKIKVELTDQEARDHIKALSVHARSVVGPHPPNASAEQIAEANRLDEQRFRLEKLVDEQSSPEG